MAGEYGSSTYTVVKPKVQKNGTYTYIAPYAAKHAQHAISSDSATTASTATKASTALSVPYIIGAAGGTPGVWTGTSSVISSYFEGLTVNYRVSTVGKEGDTTLNINGLGACHVVTESKTDVTVAYPYGALLTLIYKVIDNAGYWAISYTGDPTVKPMVSGTLTLSSGSWTNNALNVTIPGMTSTALVIVGPSVDSGEQWDVCGVSCVSQGENVLGFTCTTKPGVSLTASVMFVEPASTYTG